jgi:hypothetical protein
MALPDGECTSVWRVLPQQSIGLLAMNRQPSYCWMRALLACDSQALIMLSNGDLLDNTLVDHNGKKIGQWRAWPGLLVVTMVT